MIDLSVNYLGLQLKNPIVIASCGLTDSVKKIEYLESKGAGAVVLKSLFEEEIIIEMKEANHSMTNRQFVFPETLDYMDSVGKKDLLTNYLDLIREAKSAVTIPVIASINCVSSQKWIYFAKEIENAGADALELNLFFLPSDKKRGEKEIEEITNEVILKVRSRISIPLSLKISAYQSNLMNYIEGIDKKGINGIVLFNRSWSPDIDIHNFVITSGYVLSTPSNMGNTLRWVSMTSSRINCDIAASTGIHDGEGVIKQLLAGATVVQVASALYINGPSYLTEMLDFLSNWMVESEFSSLDDFRGRMSQANSGNPAPWERVQFMKHFRNFM
jgi:dihydroorotate dehydrogenase (fumarate)